MTIKKPTNPNKPTVHTLLYEAERKLDLFNERTKTMKLKFDFNHFDPDKETVLRTIDLIDGLLNSQFVEQKPVAPAKQT